MQAMSIVRMPWTILVGAALCTTLVTSPAAAKKGKATASPRGGERTAVFRVQVDKSHALDEHWMEIRMSRPPGKVQLTVKTEEGAIIAGAQPMSDIANGNPNPDSLQPVVTAVFNSLVGSGVLPNGTCNPPGATPGPTPLAWTYTISGCPDSLVIVINRGWASTVGPPVAVGTSVTVTYPYHFRFNSVIQLLVPGATYAATTQLTEIATVHNEM